VAPGGALAGPWVRNPLWRNARAVPSLDLQLADNKSLVDGVTGKNLVDFTRASSATFTGSDGLIKSAVTNLLLRSEELATSPWFNANVTLTNNSTDVLDPIGGNKSTKIVSTGISSAVGQGATISAASTASIWLRTSSGTASFSLVIYLSSSPFTNIGTENITVTTSWQRFSVTSSTPPSGASYNFQLQVIPVSTTIYAWGAQLEQSSTVGEYVPTVAAINSAPRFDHNPTTGESLGLLVEEARTNSLTNNMMVGAVAGTPGTLPTGWPFQVGSNGLAVSIVGTGTESGITYLDWRISGTATAAAVGDICFGRASALTAQTWTASFYLRLVAGNLSGVTGATIGLIEETAAQTFVTGALYSISLPTTALLITQRPTASRTLTGGITIALLRNNLTFNVSSGSTVDFTIRIGLPQLEQGAFATSVIPTTTATVTRAADVASISGSNFSAWYRQDEGSFFCSTFAPKGSVVFGTGDTFDNTQYVTVSALNNVPIRSGGLDQAFLTAPVSSSANTNIALGYALNSFAAVSNGGTISTDTGGAVPLAQVRLKLGSSAWDTTGVNNINGHIRRLTYWPVRLGNNVLQQITQP
jgi:hypothetical protein